MKSRCCLGRGCRFFIGVRRDRRQRADDRVMLSRGLEEHARTFWPLVNGVSAIPRLAQSRILRPAAHPISEQRSIDLESWLIDSTALRATRASSGAREKEAQSTARLRARAEPSRYDKQYLHAVRCRRIASALSVVRRTSKRYRLGPPPTGCGLLSEAARASSQTLPVLAGRQGVLRRRVAPVPGSRLNAGSHPSTQHETQTQAELAQVV